MLIISKLCNKIFLFFDKMKTGLCSFFRKLCKKRGYERNGRGNNFEENLTKKSHHYWQDSYLGKVQKLHFDFHINTTWQF